MATDATFVTNVDLSNNELRNAKAQVLSADPTGVEGKFIYNSTDKQLKFYNGTAWVAGGAAVANLSGQASAFGQSANNGSASTAARSDHYHALPAHDASAHSAIKLSDLAAPAANLAMGGYKLTGLAAGTTNGDALRYEQVVGVYALLASPTFTGVPAAPTAAVDTNTTQLATTAYVVGQGYLKSASYTAADVLTKIKTVDGTGSGLDADLLDGNEASAFALSGHNHTGTYLPLSGGTMTGTITMSNSATIAMGGAKITGLADGTAATDAVTKQQMDAAVTAAVAGLDVKQSVKYLADSLPGATYTATAGASGRGQLTNTPSTVDGVSVSAGDRILVTAVVGANGYKACGIYTVTTVGTGSNGVWDRATDFDSDADVTANAFTFVESGGTYFDTGWLMVSSGTVVVGGASGTNIQWQQFSGPGEYQWGNGLAVSGTEISVGAGAGVVADADAIRLNFTGGFSDPVDGSKTQYVARRHSVDLLDAAWTTNYYTVTHNLNTRDIVVSVREVAGSYSLVNAAVEANGVNTCRIYFATKPTTGTYRATVIA